MNKKHYWLILLNPLFLLVYALGLRTLSRFFQWGGVARRLPLIALLGGVGILWFIIWTIVYFRRKKRKVMKDNFVLPALLAELIVFVILTGFYGRQIYHSAQPYNGKLAWVLDDLRNTRKIDFEQRDFSQYGLDGIVTALEEGAGLSKDSELYTANTFSVTISADGMIERVDGYLYSFGAEENGTEEDRIDENGTEEGNQEQSWLISYDSSADKKMTVRLNGAVNTDYREQERLSPMFAMADALREQRLPGLLEPDSDQAEASYTLRYSGYTGKICESPWYRLTGEGNLTSYYDNYGENKDAYFLSISVEDAATGEDREIAAVFCGEGTMETQQQAEEKSEAEEDIAAAQEEGKTLLTDQDGSMTFYLDADNSMRLEVTDAAAGSRFYEFYNGDIHNTDPFDGNIGMAEGIYFMDARKGFILLTYASQDSSSMYYTNDGGTNFQQVTLPVDEAAEDMEGNEFSFTTGDMDYTETPYEEGGVLHVRVSTSAADVGTYALLFTSADAGVIWEYAGVQTLSGE